MHMFKKINLKIKHQQMAKKLWKINITEVIIVNN